MAVTPRSLRSRPPCQGVKTLEAAPVEAVGAGEADPLLRAAHRARERGARELGAVVLLREVRADHVLQARAVDGAEQALGVGVVEVDPLIIRQPGNNVVVVEDFHPTHELWRAAASPAMFLDAMAVAAQFLADCCVGKVDFDDFDTAQAAANRCATLAGGDDYRSFFLMLLGAEP